MQKIQLFLIVSFISATLWGSPSNSDSLFSFTINTLTMDYMEYKENGEYFDSERAHSIPGFTFGYTTGISDGLLGDRGLLDLEISSFQGETTYIGSKQGGNYGDLTTTSDNIITDTAIGYRETKRFDQMEFFTKAGLGFRYWERSLNDGYIEEYYWPYVALKTGIITEVFNNISLGVSLEYHKALHPKMYANFAGTFDLGRTDGYTLSIPFIYYISPSWAFKVAYSYQTWNIEKSNTIKDSLGQSWHEPRSESDFNRFDFGFEYHF